MMVLTLVRSLFAAVIGSVSSSYFARDSITNIGLTLVARFAGDPFVAATEIVCEILCSVLTEVVVVL